MSNDSSDASMTGHRHKPFDIGEQFAAAILRRAIDTGRADELIGCLIDGGMATIDTEGPGILLAPPEAFAGPADKAGAPK